MPGKKTPSEGKTRFNLLMRAYVDRWTAANPDKTQTDLGKACGVSRYAIVGATSQRGVLGHDSILRFADVVRLTSKERRELEKAWLEDACGKGAKGLLANRAIEILLRVLGGKEKRPEEEIVDDLLATYRTAARVAADESARERMGSR